MTENTPYYSLPTEEADTRMQEEDWEEYHKVRMYMAIIDLQRDIHTRMHNWWVNPHTKEPLEATKNLFAEKIAMVHSELSEALEAMRKDLMDDKIKTRKGAEVELADAVIRILDMAEFFGFDVASAMYEKMAYNDTREDHKLENRVKVGGKAI